MVNGKPTLSPVIPSCTPAQFLAFDPTIECSTGSITAWEDQGRTVYDGLLMKLQKSLSHHYQFTASYAYQKELSISAINLDNLRAGYGQALFHHNLNVSGVAELPFGIKMSLNNTIHSPAPGTPHGPRRGSQRLREHNVPDHRSHVRRRGSGSVLWMLPTWAAARRSSSEASQRGGMRISPGRRISAA